METPTTPKALDDVLSAQYWLAATAYTYGASMMETPGYKAKCRGNLERAQTYVRAALKELEE